MKVCYVIYLFCNEHNCTLQKLNLCTQVIGFIEAMRNFALDSYHYFSRLLHVLCLFLPQVSQLFWKKNKKYLWENKNLFCLLMSKDGNPEHEDKHMMNLSAGEILRAIVILRTSPKERCVTHCWTGIMMSFNIFRILYQSCCFTID